MLYDKKISVIGLGLIGGSISLALQDFFPAIEIRGIDKEEEHRRMAVQNGICGETGSLEEIIPVSDIIIVATPVDHIEEVLPSVLDLIKDTAVVIDTGSTKFDICEKVKNHHKRDRFVACHPLAGTENSGPNAAFAALFRNKRNIICEAELSAPDALAVARYLMEILGMQNIELNAALHDKHIAYVSHLSHISSFMLGATVMEIEDDKQQIYEMAGTGFESTVRLAKSSPEMWTPIFEQNKSHVCDALTAYIQKLESFRQLMLLGRWEEVYGAMRQANEIRPILEGLVQEIKA